MNFKVNSPSVGASNDGLVKNYFKGGFTTKAGAKNHEILKKEEFNNKIFTNDEITFEEVFNEYISSLDTKSSTILTKQKCYIKLINCYCLLFIFGYTRYF